MSDGTPKEDNNELLLPPSEACLTDLKSISNTPLLPLNLSEIGQICLKLMKSSLPTSLATFASMGISMTSLGYIGHYGTPIELAGAGLATIWGNVFYFGLIVSLNMAFQIIASQLYGANKHQELLRTFQKTVYVITIITVPLFVWLLVVNRFFALFEANQEINDNSEIYLIASLPSLYFSVITDVFRNCLRSQNYFFVQGAAQVVGAILHFFWSYLFVVGFDMPLVGSAIARFITDGSTAVFLFWYVHKIHTETGRDLKWSLDCLAGWPSYLKRLALIGWNSYVVWIFYGIVGFMVSAMNDEYIIGAFGLASTLSAFLPTLPMGNSFTLQVYLSNALGAGWKYKAQKIVFAGLSLCLCFSITNVLIIVLWNDAIGAMLTSDLKTKEIYIEMVFIYAIMIIPEAFAEHLCGIVRTMGQEKKVFLSSNLVFLVLGVPLAWTLAFPLGKTYVGIWEANVIEMYLMFFIVLKIFLSLDWDLAINKIHERIEREPKVQSKEMSPLRNKEYV